MENQNNMNHMNNTNSTQQTNWFQPGWFPEEGFQ